MTITGPATKNIFDPNPNTSPSFLNSIAQDAMLFAKPEIGTNVPAPPNFAILSKKPNAVARIVIVIMIMLIQEPTLSISMVGLYAFIISPNICPNTQNIPPTINAWNKELNHPVFGVSLST